MVIDSGRPGSRQPRREGCSVPAWAFYRWAGRRPALVAVTTSYKTHGTCGSPSSVAGGGVAVPPDLVVLEVMARDVAGFHVARNGQHRFGPVAFGKHALHETRYPFVDLGSSCPGGQGEIDAVHQLPRIVGCSSVRSRYPSRLSPQLDSNSCPRRRDYGSFLRRWGDHNVEANRPGSSAIAPCRLATPGCPRTAVNSSLIGNIPNLQQTL